MYGQYGNSMNRSRDGRAMVPKEKGRDDGCCGIDFLKYVLFIFNFIFWLSGVVILLIGIWTVWDKYHYISLLTTSTYTATTYLLLGTGAVVIIVGFLGCCGAWRENRCCLMTYASFLLLIFLLEAVVGILAYMYEAAVHDELVRSLNKTMRDNYKMVDQETITHAIDDMQQHFKCCGAKDFRDWKKSSWLKGNPELNNTAPDSCCKTVSLNCALRDHPSNIYYNGCIHELEAYLKVHLIILGAVGLGICCLQIFGIVFACCLAKKIKEWRDRQAALAWIG